MKMRFAILALISFLFYIKSEGQGKILNPVKWRFEIEKVSGNDYKLKYIAKVDKGWTVYSQYTADDGPVPTSINYDEISGIELIGKTTESGAKKEGMDPYFGVNVIKFTADKPFVIEQKIKVINASKPIVGYVNFMACDNEKCLPPTDAEFTLRIPPDGAAPITTENIAEPVKSVVQDGKVIPDPSTPDTSGVAQAATDRKSVV